MEKAARGASIGHRGSPAASGSPARLAAGGSGEASKRRPSKEGTPTGRKEGNLTGRKERTRYKAAAPAAARGGSAMSTTPQAKRSIKVAQSEPPLRKKQPRQSRMDSFELSPSQASGSHTPMYSSGARARKKVADSSTLSLQAQELLSTILEDSHDGGYSSSSSFDSEAPRRASASASPAVPSPAKKRQRAEEGKKKTSASSSAGVAASKRATAAAVAANARAATSSTVRTPKQSTPQKRTSLAKAMPVQQSQKRSSSALPSNGRNAGAGGAAVKANANANAGGGPGAGGGAGFVSAPEDGSESVYSDGFSYVHEILRLEGELKSKEHQLAGLVQETCRMERLLSKKEEALFELSVELHQAQETILQLDTTGEAAAKHKAISAVALKALLEGKREREDDDSNAGGEDSSLALNAALKKKKEEAKAAKGSASSRLEREFRNISSKRSPTISYNATLPEDLYHHVMDLDNELAERERECNKLREENRQYSLRNKELHLYYKRAVVELRDYKETKEELFLTEKHELEEKVLALSRREKQLIEELRATKSADRTKGQVIKSLEEQIEREEALEKRLKLLRVEMKQLEQRNSALRSDNSRQKKIIARKDKSLAKADAVQEAGIPYHLWKEERSQLTTKLNQLKELKDRNERTIEKQKLRIHELCDRIDLIASSLYEDSRNVTASRRMELINGSRRFPSRANTSTRRGGGGGAAPLPIIIDDSDTEVEEAELTEDLLDYDDGQESSKTTSTLDADGSISIRLYNLLEQEVRSLHQVIGERDAVLADKDATIESLERELASLSRTKVVRSQEETDRLKEKLESVEAQNKNREKQYRLKLHKMQAKLEDQE